MGCMNTGRKCCGPDGRRLGPAHTSAAQARTGTAHPTLVVQLLSIQTLSPAMAQILPGPGARVPPPLPDHLVEEILVRVASPADLARAAAACASFRRLVAAASFLRRYRSLHLPLLLGILTARRFLPAEARHPNALTAYALVRAADFSQCQGTGWIYCDARAGRVLLMRSKHAGGHILPELAVCDPLTRGCTPLPTIPESLVASVLGPARGEHIGNFIAFFVPAAD